MFTLSLEKLLELMSIMINALSQDLGQLSQQVKISVARTDPAFENRWAAVTNCVSNANLAHLPQWCAAISNAYQHVPLYMEAEDLHSGELALLPSFIVRSRLFGTVVSSMPFLDVGGPCGRSSEVNAALVAALVEESTRIGASVVELRCTEELPIATPPNKDKVNLALPLPSDPQVLWKKLNAKVRNQIRKAERAKLSVEFGGAEKLKEFYKVFAVNMRDLGSPVHGRGFYDAIFHAFGEKARVALVRKDSLCIGGLVSVAFKDALIVPWASSLREYFSLCPNMLLYWETILRACEGGFRRFEFGRSSRDSGTYLFKRQWGAEGEPLFWYTIPIRPGRRRNLSSGDKRGAFLVELWRRLPLSVSRLLGPQIRRYLTQ